MPFESQFRWYLLDSASILLSQNTRFLVVFSPNLCKLVLCVAELNALNISVPQILLNWKSNEQMLMEVVDSLSGSRIEFAHDHWTGRGSTNCKKIHNQRVEK